MPRNLIMTEDGSSSIRQAPGVTYHSVHGAIQESMHIFIRAGMESLQDNPKRSPTQLNIFELGFGTGLNALLTLIGAERTQVVVNYEVIEAFPLEANEVAGLNYCTQLGRPDLQAVFEQMHTAPWDQPVTIIPGFILHKAKASWPAYRLQTKADLIYYDAFDPVYQPQLWTADVFTSLKAQVVPNAVLVTYCCKGVVKRALQAAGFMVTKLPGPPGKREIIRAYAKE